MKLLIPLDSISSCKSKELLPLECEHCCAVFYKRKGDVRMSLKRHPDFALRFCSLKCHHLKRVKDTHTEVVCRQCSKLVVKQVSWIKENRHSFCSRSCSAKFQNLNKTLGGSRKSKAEIYLAELIRADFETLNVEENVRGVLPSGLELDLYLPTLNLAIELNGPLHTFPIFGLPKLRSIQNKDARKRSEAKAVGCVLIVLDTSDYKYWPETMKFLDNQYEEKIRPVITMLGAARTAP